MSGEAALNPGDHLQSGLLKLYGTRGAKPDAALHFISALPITRGADTRQFTFFLGAGTWKLQLRYANPGVITTGLTAVRTRTVG